MKWGNCLSPTSNLNLPKLNDMSKLEIIYNSIITSFSQNINFSLDEFCNAPYNEKSLQCMCVVCNNTFNVCRRQILESVRNCTAIENLSLFTTCPTCRCTKKQHRCKFCNKLIPSSRTFCNTSCAASYNNKRRTKASRDKQKTTLMQTLAYSTKRKRRVCKVCGSVECTTPHICKSRLCTGKSKNLEKVGFDFNLLGSQLFIEQYYSIKEKLHNLYHVQHYTLTDLMRMFDIKDSHSIYTIFKFLGISTRNSKEAAKLALRLGRSSIPTNDKTRYKSGYHTTWFGEVYFFRSSYEEDYMILLDQCQEPYNYESLRIVYYNTQDKENKIAVPDFYLPSSHTIVEIKSSYTYDKQNMVDRSCRFKELGYNFKLILDHVEYDYCPDIHQVHTIFE